MARPRTTSPCELVEKAMLAFWTNGYEGTSMADLVKATGSTRQTIYGDFQSKMGLYDACFGLYRDRVVDPALAPIDQHSGTDAIAFYFETQIGLAETMGLPGPGCMVGNAMTQMAPKDDAIMAHVDAHNRHLEAAFARCLPSEWPKSRLTQWAQFLVLAAQGLWALSRVTAHAAILRQHAKTIVAIIEREAKNAD